MGRGIRVRWTRVNEPTSVEIERLRGGCEKHRCRQPASARVFVGKLAAYAGGWCVCRAHFFEMLAEAADLGQDVSVRDFGGTP